MNRRDAQGSPIVKVRLSRADCELLRRALDAAGESVAFTGGEAALDEAHKLAEKTLARNGQLWMTVHQGNVDTLLSVIDVVSGSAAFAATAAAVQRLHHAFRDANTALNRKG